MAKLMSAAPTFEFPRVVDVKSVGESYAGLRQVWDGGHDLHLDISGVVDADVSLIQMILAARRSAAEQGLSLTLAAPAPEPVVRLLERGGFIGPAPDARRDFWLAA